MAPALLIGFIFGLLITVNDWKVGEPDAADTVSILILLWVILYGLGLHSASFFMTRGTRLFSWGFLATGIILSFGSSVQRDFDVSLHFLMGILFGASHLAYGIYLYFTERKNET